MARAGAVGASALLVLLASGASARTEQTPRQEWETHEVAEGVYQFQYRAHYNLFVLTPGGVVAFDPIAPVAAERYAAEIRRLAPAQRLRAIVYSHHHADHASGAPVLRREFGDEVPIIAHSRTLAPLREAADPDLPPPDLTFDERLVLHSDERPIELHYLGASHTDSMIVALLPVERIAFAVDFVSNDAVGYRELSSHVFPDFFETLRRLQQLDCETILFGHGPPGDRQTIARQITYYDDLREAVAAAVEAGLSEDEAAATVRLPAYEAWRGYAEFFPLNVRGLYRWLTPER